MTTHSTHFTDEVDLEKFNYLLDHTSRLAKLAKNNLDSLMTSFKSGHLHSITAMKYNGHKISLAGLSTKKLFLKNLEIKW